MKMNNKNERWLWITPFVMLLLVGGSNLWRSDRDSKTKKATASGGFSGGVGVDSPWDGKKGRSVSIGFFKDPLAQERAAFKRLSAEMKQHPKETIYRIRSSSPKSPERDFLLYSRTSPSPPPGSSAPLPGPCLAIKRQTGKDEEMRGKVLVSEARIHAVARQSGGYDDFYQRSTRQFQVFQVTKASR